MRILAIDTAADRCAACVWDSETRTELGRAVEFMRTGHAERATAVIRQALHEAGVGLRSLDRIGVCVGPGSFTGIRVGVAAARGFSVALEVAAIGISTLEALALEARREHPGRPVIVLLGSGGGPFPAAAYNAAGEPIGDPTVMDLAAAEALAESLTAPVLTGSAAGGLAARLRLQSFSLATVQPTADIATIAELAAAREPGPKPVPLYMRAPDAKPQQAASVARLPG